METGPSAQLVHAAFFFKTPKLIPIACIWPISCIQCSDQLARTPWTTSQLSFETVWIIQNVVSTWECWQNLGLISHPEYTNCQECSTVKFSLGLCARVLQSDLNQQPSHSKARRLTEPRLTNAPLCWRVSCANHDPSGLPAYDSYWRLWKQGMVQMPNEL